MLPIPEVPPKLLARLRTSPGRMPVTVHLVLEEDDYETKYGDGRFLALRAAFLDPEAAKARRDQLAKENEERLQAKKATVGHTYHLKTVRLILDESKNQIFTDAAYPTRDIVRLLTSP